MARRTSLRIQGEAPATGERYRANEAGVADAKYLYQRSITAAMNRKRAGRVIPCVRDGEDESA